MKTFTAIIFMLISTNVFAQAQPAERREMVTTYDTTVLYSGLKEKHDWAYEQAIIANAGKRRICRKCYRHEEIKARTYYKYTGKLPYEAVLKEFEKR